MTFVFSRLIFSPACALCSIELGSHLLAYVLFLRRFLATSSAKSRSVKQFCFCQTMPYSVLSMVLCMTKSITMMKRNGERMQPCRTPETISKNSVYPLAVLTQQLELMYSAWKMLMNRSGMYTMTVTLLITRC